MSTGWLAGGGTIEFTCPEHGPECSFWKGTEWEALIREVLKDRSRHTQYAGEGARGRPRVDPTVVVGTVGDRKPELLAPIRSESSLDSAKAMWAVLFLIIAAEVHWIAREPWHASQLKTVTGTVADYSEVRRAKRSCFSIQLAAIKESFELCSTSYRLFDRPAFEQEVRKGDSLQVQVVNEIKTGRGGETNYSVQGLQRPGGRVYLDLDRVQTALDRERVTGNILVVCLVVAAVVTAIMAVKRSTERDVRPMAY